MGSEWQENVAGLAAEIEDADFGDERLRRRAVHLLEALAADPAKSFPQVFKDESQLEAAYRFFNNDAVDPESVLEPHVAARLERMRQRDVVLVVHDTTTMSFRPDGQRRGLGRLRSAGQAFFAHFSLAVAGDGTREPVGVLGLSAHVRDGRSDKANEHDRWCEQVEVVAKRIDPKRVVHVMDREADDYRLLVLLSEGKHRFVIRIAVDRLLQADEEHQARKLS